MTDDYFDDDVEVTDEDIEWAFALVLEHDPGVGEDVLEAACATMTTDEAALVHRVITEGPTDAGVRIVALAILERGPST